MVFYKDTTEVRIKRSKIGTHKMNVLYDAWYVRAFI